MSASTRRWPLPVIWLAAGLPILAWTIHLTASAALAREQCTHDSVTWVLHGLTVGLGLVCIACGLIGLSVWRRAAREDAEGPFQFIGVLVVAIAAVNLLVIVWEGSYTPFLTSCH
jgi:hypothetical protein